MTVVEVETDVPTAVARIEQALRQLEITLFARIDHAAGARAVGLELPDEVVLVFGDPAAGTPLMQVDPQVGLDLPLRMLVWARGDRTAVGYRDPHRLDIDIDANWVRPVLDKMTGLLERLARAAAGDR
jgi:uncharacterized protein (DUF302 family)